MYKLLQQVRSNQIFLITIIEFFERFAFFGIRSFFILHLSDHFSFQDRDCFDLYAAFMALIYATSLGGSFLSDYVLGSKRSLLLGFLMMGIGYILLCISNINIFYWGLSFLILGSGLFKPNIMSLLGAQTVHSKKQRDAHFTVFYIGINMAGVLAPLVCGFIGQLYDQRWVFFLAFISIFLGLLLFIKDYKYLDNTPQAISKRAYEVGYFNSQWWLIFPFFMALFLMVKLLENPNYIHFLMPLLGLLALIGCLVTFIQSSPNQRKRLIAIFFTMFVGIWFFALLEQSGSSLILFSERYVERSVGQYVVSTSQLQALSPFLVIFLGPFIAFVWNRLAQKDKDLSPLLKILIGLICLGLGFICVVLGIHSSSPFAKVSLIWIAAISIFHVLGELLINPVGLSIISHLAPSHLKSIFMSYWFIVISFGHYLSGFIAKLSVISPNNQGEISFYPSLSLYEQAFFKMSLITLFLSLIIVMLYRRMNSYFIQ